MTEAVPSSRITTMRSRPVLRHLAAFAAATGLLSGSAWASSSPDALPTVNIGTAIPADSTALPSDPATIEAQPAPAAPKPVRRVSRLQLQTIDTASLATAMSDSGGGRLHGTVPVIQAHATAMRPAPLPDQDVDAPGPDAQTLAAQQQASVGPSFYGNKDHFSGDGFSAGSNLESDKNNRRRPGGGMSLSIPMP